MNISDGRPQRGYSAVGVEKTASLYGKIAGQEIDPEKIDARVDTVVHMPSELIVDESPRNTLTAALHMTRNSRIAGHQISQGFAKQSSRSICVCSE